MNPTAAAKIMEENMKTIFAYALSRVSDKNDAEDLAGDIIVNFLANADKLRDDRAVFGYIWTIAANTAKKFLQKRSRYASHTADLGDGEDEDSMNLDDFADPDSDFTGEIERREEIMTLRREIALLSKEYRECTVAYYFDGLSCREISEKFGISVEMVKYYLYKTRRILKEGMTMTRAFGEKSYKPAVFHFHTIFAGQFNREYQNMLNRKLPGNILYSAYYTPMTIGELSVELGVAAVYLEDEMELLKKYDLVTETAGGKYQTKLCIFTEAFDAEFRRAAEAQFTGRLGAILGKVRAKLPAIRAMGFPGCGKDDNALLWAFYFKLICEGNSHWKGENQIEYPRDLYDHAKGVNYGIDYEEGEGIYSSNAFAGYYGLRETVAACMADLGVLGEKNAMGSGKNWARLNELIDASLTGGEDAPMVYLQPEQVDMIFGEILAGEVAEMGVFYRDLTDCAVQVMRNHAPKAVAGEVDAVLKSTVFHRTVGLMGKLAVDTGVMRQPDDDLPASAFLFAAKKREAGMKGDCSN